MKIKAIKLYEEGFMQGDFALGGGVDPAMLNETRTFPSSLQNFLIDTGSEVILVDTGIPKGVPDAPPKEGQKIYQGHRITDYVSALESEGYTPDQVTKVLLTHKHPDHSGELRSFPNAKIYAAPEEITALKLEGSNIEPAHFNDGPYYNFERSQKIAEGITFVFAPGHTKGNSIVVAEWEGLFYMMHGDVTYTDTALRENKLSVVFEDVEQAKVTLNQVRAFIENQPTVYLSTHTPEALEHLENKAVMKL